jgi:hypothetical protein
MGTNMKTQRTPQSKKAPGTGANLPEGQYKERSSALSPKGEVSCRKQHNQAKAVRPELMA